jgi:imidazolonepropionase-like amidohydrolase
VVVARERIAAVGPSGELQVPAGALRVHGRGKYLLPGLADMHVHAHNRSDLELLAAAGVTLMRNMAGRPYHVPLRAWIDGPESFAPRLVTAAPILDGDPPNWGSSTVVTSVEDAERVIVAQKQAGYDFAKVYNGLSAPVYAALAEAALRHRFPLVGHVPDAVPLRDILTSGQRSIEHMEGYSAALEKDPARRVGRWLDPEPDESRFAEVAAATAASGVWNCPTLVFWDRASRLDAVVELAAATRWLELASPNLTRQWDPRTNPRAARFAEHGARLRRHYGVCARMLRTVFEAGGKLLVGTDMGNPFVVPGASLHDEIELLVAAGVPRAAVLRAATAGAHEFLGEPANGSVAAGARADLVLADSDPLRGPIAIPPAGVMMRGRWRDRAMLQGSLDAIPRRRVPGNTARVQT